VRACGEVVIFSDNDGDESLRESPMGLIRSPA
jgi:hypothetical protein